VEEGKAEYNIAIQKESRKSKEYFF